MNDNHAASTSPWILLYGNETLLLHTRTMVLEQAGFRVFSAVEAAEAERIILRRNVALIVLCHSLSTENCESILEFAERHAPAMKTLVLTADISPCAEQTSGAVLTIFDGPRRFVAIVRQVLEVALSIS